MRQKVFIAIASAALGAVPLNGAANILSGTPLTGSGLLSASVTAADNAFGAVEAAGWFGARPRAS